MIFGPRFEGCTARPIKSDRMAIMWECIHRTSTLCFLLLYGVKTLVRDERLD